MSSDSASSSPVAAAAPPPPTTTVKAKKRRERKGQQPAHEVRFLRSEVQRLGYQQQLLAAKWLDALPDPDARLAACEVARQRLLTRRIEKHNADLRGQLVAMQLEYALLHRSLADAPLEKLARMCEDMFARLHGFVHLGSNMLERMQQLQTRADLAIRLAPEIAEVFASSMMEELQALPLLVPLSRTNTSGSDDGTLVANVFACKLPLLGGQCPLQRVFDAAVSASQKLNDTDVIQSRIGMQVDSELIHDLGAGRHYSSLARHDGVFSGSVSSLSFAAEMMSDDVAVVVSDFVDDDDLLHHQHKSDEEEGEEDPDDLDPSYDDRGRGPPRSDASRILVLTQHLDAARNQRYVLLRRLLVVRYNVLAHSPVLAQELQLAAPLINGDLLMALLCEALQAADASGGTEPPV